MTTETKTTLRDRLAEHVSSKAVALQTAYRKDDAAAVANLARLRRGIAQPPGRDARLVGLTLAGLYDNPGSLPDETQDAEYAAYTALTLFALHQQSHRDAGMHRTGFSFGRSARLLGRHSGARDAVRARFTAVATASTWDELVHHARGIIQQLRSYGIALDYGEFAADLLDLRSPESADRVRLVWGRHFYRVRHAEDDATGADAEDQDGDREAADDTDDTDEDH